MSQALQRTQQENKQKGQVLSIATGLSPENNEPVNEQISQRKPEQKTEVSPEINFQAVLLGLRKLYSAELSRTVSPLAFMYRNLLIVVTGLAILALPAASTWWLLTHTPYVMNIVAGLGTVEFIATTGAIYVSSVFGLVHLIIGQSSIFGIIKNTFRQVAKVGQSK